MADQPDRKQINFTIVPDEHPNDPRTYANFCSIAHTPFDFTLTFCEVMPLSEKELREAESEHVVRAPVRARRRAGSVRAESDYRAAGAHARLLGNLYERRVVEARANSLKGGPATRRIIETLAEQHPNADTELHYRNAFELLVATIPSAQSTDQRVNMVTPALFKRADARALQRRHRPSSKS